MKKRLWLLFSLLFLNTSLAFAGNVPGAFTVTLADAYYDYASSWQLKNTFLPNFALAYNVTDRLGLEAGAGFFNTKHDDDDQHIHGWLYTLDGIFRFAKYGHLEPYVIGGLGMIAINHNGTDNKHPGNINAGLGAQLFWGNTIAMRAEIRDLYSTTGSGRNDLMFNFGVSFLFGGKTVKNFKGE
ncbi:MAG TPA: OmpA family protein [Gammaproteobacteria bacterium]|jgi:OOP family OmpA-OmpF porin|nr:OmpA family protein [Gammaproteobacteria bacterium]